MKVETDKHLKKGNIGYKVCSHSAGDWKPKKYKYNNNKHWSGFYTAETIDTAEGYSPDYLDKNGNGIIYINKIILKTDVKLVVCMDNAFKLGRIGEDTKEMKNFLNVMINEKKFIREGDLFMPELGKLKYFFKCYCDPSGGIEIITPNQMVSELDMKSCKKYSYKKWEKTEIKL